MNECCIEILLTDKNKTPSTYNQCKVQNIFSKISTSINHMATLALFIQVNFAHG